jgi:hypothetical protein
MPYTTLGLQIDPTWLSNQAFALSPGGRTTGRASKGEGIAYVVVWGENGSLDHTFGPFDTVDWAVANDAGDVVATVRRNKDTYPELAWLRAGKDAVYFAPPAFAFVAAVNDSGLIAATSFSSFHLDDSRAFSLQLPSGVPVFHDVPGASGVAAADVNDAGELLLNAVIAGVTRSFLVDAKGARRELGAFTLHSLNNSHIAVGYDGAYLPGFVDTSASTPAFVQLPLPPALLHAVVLAVNERGQSTGYAWGVDGHGFIGVLWDKSGVVSLNTLDPTPLWIGYGIDHLGRILTNLSGLAGPPALLVPPPTPIHSGVVGPIWEIVFGEVGGQPVAGVKGVGVTVLLPNGQQIQIPVIVTPPIGPGTDPGPVWQLLSERDRARVVAAALTRMAGTLTNAAGKHILEHASQQLAALVSAPRVPRT